MADELKVGGELDAWCTACKLMKWHTIVAIVDGKPAKVECQGCHKQHQFRASPPGEKDPAATKPVRARKSRASATPDVPPPPDYETLLAGRGGEARSYSPNERYTVGDVLRHPSFGVGVVAASPAAQRIEVAFPGERKFLVHDRGSPGAAERLSRPPRRDDEKAPSGTSDSPRGIK